VIAVALSGGGERVVGWQVGVLAGLADSGLDLRGATAVIGTSAGAVVAARLAAGIDPRADAAATRPTAPSVDAFTALADAWPAAGATLAERRRAFGQLAVQHSPGGEDAFVTRIGQRLPSVIWPAALRVAAIDAERGERVVFDAGSGVAPARAIAASRAVPTLLPPVTIDGRTFVDGALGSATNADALVDVDAPLVLVITAVPPEPAERGPDSFWQAALDDEVALLEDAGHEVVVVHATGDLALASGRRRGRLLADQIRPRRAA
jgi:NTE family protein